MTTGELESDVSLRSPRRRVDTIVLSYLSIRRSLGTLGFLLPLLLGPVGWLVLDIDIQENMSSYYHTPLRDVFVGVLCAIGIFLFCYRGYDAAENWTGNVGCVSAIGIALCPLDAGSDPLRQSSVLGYLHTLFGGVFFLTLGAYSLYHFPRGNRLLRVGTRDEKRDAVYRLTGLAIAGCLLAMGVHLFLLSAGAKLLLNRYCFTFWMEWVAVWAFAAAWLTKGHAILADYHEDQNA